MFQKHNHTISTLVHISFLKREMKQCGFYFDGVVFATFVVRFQHVEESVYIKIFLTDFLFFQHLAVFRSHKLIEGIEAWNDVAFLFQFADKQGYGI